MLLCQVTAFLPSLKVLIWTKVEGCVGILLDMVSLKGLWCSVQADLSAGFDCFSKKVEFISFLAEYTNSTSLFEVP